MNTYVIFFNNGTSIEVTADSFEWDEDDEDILTFFDDESNRIACFKIESLYGVSLGNCNMHKELLALPLYNSTNNTES